MSYRPLSFFSVFGIFWEGSSPMLGNPYFLCKNCAISRRCSPLPRRPDGFCVLDNLADARMLWHTLSSADIALRTFKQRAQPPTLEGAECMLCELVLPWIGSRDNQNGTMCFTLVELTDRAACSRTSFLLLKLFATKRFCHPGRINRVGFKRTISLMFTSKVWHKQNFQNQTFSNFQDDTLHK